MNKNSKSGLLALGLAVFAYWKYKMTPEQKQNLKTKVTDAGKGLWDKVPQSVKNVVKPQAPEQVS